MKVRFVQAIILAALALTLTMAITEDENFVSMKDASLSKERPRISGYDMDEDTMRQVDENKENFSFNADVSRLMDIIINSLYTKKDVFIRELISNASDALDKARFLAVKDPDFLGEIPDLEVKIDFDYEAKTLSITDTGIGMTKAELVKNLGTVAKSGTTAFLEAIGTGESSMSMIGQFGVGFYSAYLVANKVVVTSKNKDDDQHIWTSTADSKFVVSKDPRGDTLGRGTRVTLHLKDDAMEYTEENKIKTLVKRYSEFINYPISLYTSQQEDVEVPFDEQEPESQIKIEHMNENQDDVEITTEEESDSYQTEDDAENPKTKMIKKQVWQWERINNISAIWMRPKDEITDRDYNEFYKTITKDTSDPLAHTHFSAEGEIEFRAILYVPRSAPFDLFEDYYGVSSALKLYVRRVLITEEFTDLMPKYLNFVKGVVDSDDLPLNVSREQLQQMKMIKVMSKKLVRKTIDMIAEIAEDSYEYENEDEDATTTTTNKDADKEDENEAEAGNDKKVEDEEDKYEIFWGNFGKSIKLGVIEDASNRMKLAKLLRFHTTNDDEELTSLDEYISRMKDDQDTILYLPGDSKSQILKSPILKKYRSQGYEVLILHDPIDEFTLQHLSEYEKRQVKSIAKDDVNLFENSAEAKEKTKKLKEMYKPLTEFFKKHLNKQVEKVSISSKLEDAPLFIFTSQYGYSAQMEKINKNQALANQEKAPSYMLAKKNLELNPSHPTIKALLELVKENDGSLPEEMLSYVDLMFQMAMLNSGFNVDEPSDLTVPLEKLIRVGFKVDRDEPCEDIEIELDEVIDAEEIDMGEDEPEEIINMDMNDEL